MTAICPPDCERICFYCSKPPSLGCVVMAALGNESSQESVSTHSNVCELRLISPKVTWVCPSRSWGQWTALPHKVMSRDCPPASSLTISDLRSCDFLSRGSLLALQVHSTLFPYCLLAFPDHPGVRLTDKETHTGGKPKRQKETNRTTFSCHLVFLSVDYHPRVDSFSKNCEMLLRVGVCPPQIH